MTDKIGSRADILGELTRAVMEFDADMAIAAAKQAINLGVNPVEAIELGLAKGLEDVGDKFAKGEVFIPELVLAGEAMKAGLEILRPEVSKRMGTIQSSGKFLVGTVEGDVHDIGKSIVASMFFAAGFEIHDLGNNIKVDSFVENVERIKPHVLGLSALMTTTIPQQKYVIEALKEVGLRNKVMVMVGGAATSDEWSKEIGADGWAQNAIEAVRVAKNLMRREK